MRILQRPLRSLLVFGFFFLSAQLAGILPLARAATTSTEVGGPIISDTTWTAADSPYLATSGVLVMENATLTIEPGVTVKFSQDSALLVNGELIARGTAAKPIVFTSAQSTPAPGDWPYVRFNEQSVPGTADEEGGYADGSILEHVTIEYAGAGDGMCQVL